MAQVITLEEYLANILNNVPDPLRQYLQERDGVSKVVHLLTDSASPIEREDTDKTGFNLWTSSWLYYQNSGRFYEALALSRRWYESLCRTQVSGRGRLHKGAPLARLRDSHLRLGHIWLAQKYILLATIEDAIWDKGAISVNDTGSYHRFVTEQGMSDESYKRIAQHTYEIYKEKQFNEYYYWYPEFILQELERENLIARSIPQPHELSIYEQNQFYSKTLLEDVGKNRSDGKTLERLVAYLLSEIPGFEVTPKKQARDLHFDVFIRNRGNHFDFRSDLGRYILGEAKDYTKDKASVQDLSHFVQKIINTNCRSGFFVSYNGFTGDAEGKEAATRYSMSILLKAFHRSGVVVLPIQREEIETTINGGISFLSVLEHLYEQVRFDLPTS